MYHCMHLFQVCRVFSSSQQHQFSLSLFHLYLWVLKFSARSSLFCNITAFPLTCMPQYGFYSRVKSSWTLWEFQLWKPLSGVIWQVACNRVDCRWANMSNSSQWPHSGSIRKVWRLSINLPYCGPRRTLITTTKIYHSSADVMTCFYICFILVLN